MRCGFGTGPATLDGGGLIGDRLEELDRGQVHPGVVCSLHGYTTWCWFQTSYSVDAERTYCSQRPHRVLGVASVMRVVVVDVVSGL